MTNEQIKDYLKKYRIDSEEQLAKHIEELKKNTIPNNEIIFPLVDLLLNEKSVLLSFLAENKKQEMYTRTVTPFFLGEMLGKCSTQCFCDGSCKKPQEKKLGGYIKPNVYVNSTRHKAREEGKFHKEIVGDLEGINRPPSTDDKNLAKKDNYTIYVFTKDLLPKILEFEDLRAIKSILKRYGASSYRVYDKDKNLIEQGVLSKDDVITNSNRGEKETMEYLQGVKETEGKLNYELDWEFIQQMAERMSQNKGKYEPYNWKRPMEVEKLKQSLFRHVIEIMKGNYSDDGRDFGHFESVALNSMMINYQLKNNV